jgi:hypothetical protein
MVAIFEVRTRTVTNDLAQRPTELIYGCGADAEVT